MAIPFRDGNNNLVYGETAGGTGTAADPHLFKQSVAQLGQWVVAPAPSNTANISSVTAATNSTNLLAANSARKPGSTIFNDSSAILYLALGSASASTASFTVKVAPDSSYQLPNGYLGQVQGVWASAIGAARITELQ